MSIRCASVYINICILYEYLHIILYFGRMSLFIIHIQLAQKDGKEQSFFLHFLSFQTQAKASMHYIRLAFFFRMVRFLFVFFYLHGYADNFDFWLLD